MISTLKSGNISVDDNEKWWKLDFQLCRRLLKMVLFRLHVLIVAVMDW